MTTARDNTLEARYGKREATRRLNAARAGVGFFVGAGIPKGEKLRCWTCQGNGMTQYPHCDPVTCADCDGKGYRYRRVNTFAECGCCGAYHRTDFHGDCREDSERHWDLPDDAEVIYLGR